MPSQNVPIWLLIEHSCSLQSQLKYGGIYFGTDNDNQGIGKVSKIA
jgi:hypothetical protein